jgi:hypothetical protein
MNRLRSHGVPHKSSSSHAMCTETRMIMLRSHSLLIASPAKRAFSAAQSPEESGLFSPGFTLYSPFGEFPMSSCSAIISPSMFDVKNNESNLSCEVETDFFDTFQITAVASNISSLISLEDDDCPEEDEDYENLMISESETAPKYEKKSRSKAYQNTFSSPVATTSKPKAKSKRDMSPDEGVQCKCKKSQCLKLYCDCFASSKYCHASCKCIDCMNSKDSENVSYYY